MIVLPKIDKIENIIVDDNEKLSSSGRFHYVKLHGSQNWLSSDGKHAMVIGRNKPEQIDCEPLLDWYFKTFKQVLSFPNRRLLVIGYGFRDAHINEIIASSIAKHGLKLYVISPNDHEKFRADLHTRPCGMTLWKGLSGYFPYELEEMYPGDNYETEYARYINATLFH